MEKLKKSHTENVQSPEDTINTLDLKISDILQSLESAGLNMGTWNEEYDNLPDNLIKFNFFYKKLCNFQERRSDALSTLEFDLEMSNPEKDQIRNFDREVIGSFKDFDNYLGNGATAEVYGMRNNDTICIKFITDQERYNENNSIRKEHDYLATVYEATKKCAVRTPYPVFVRIHPTEGHSYGMEKIHGASLSQILEFPDTYLELLKIIQYSDREKLESNLLDFVSEMHASGVTHGDLFKRNLMFDENGRLYVIDFGKSKTINFEGDVEEGRKSDIYLAKQSLREFYVGFDSLTK